VPRNEYLGALSDFLAKSYSPERTQQMQGISELLGLPAVSRTLDMMSYGDPLTTGAGGLGGTTRVKPDVLEAAMTVAPLGKPATMATLQAARLARQAAMAGGKAGERYAERVVPQIMERGGLGAEMLGAMSNRTISPLDVYHGTPHRFPPTERNPLGEFDASKIGTGEGNQAYGPGIYTAEARPVAEGYAGNLTFKNNQGIKYEGKATKEIEDSLKELSYFYKNAENIDFSNKKELTDFVKNAAQLLEEEGSTKTAKTLKSLDVNKLYENKGNLYKVDLPDEKIAKMLDYDKHMSEQSPEVQKILLPYQKEIGSSFGTGEQTLKAIAFERRMKGLDDSPLAVAQQLREMGISGVKYFDEMSRGAGKGTRNFVTFPGEEKNLTILERNGQKATRTNNLTRK